MLEQEHKLIPLEELYFENHDRTANQLKKVQTLATNLRNIGQITPIVVVYDESKEKYRILTGKRRFHAAKLAGIKRLKAVVLEDVESEHALILSDNLLNNRIDPIMRARYFKMLLDKGIYRNQLEMAAALGIHQGFISREIKLLEETPEVQEAIVRGELSKKAVARRKLEEKKHLPEASRKNLNNRRRAAHKQLLERVSRRVPDEKLPIVLGERHLKMYLLSDDKCRIVFEFKLREVKDGIRQRVNQELMEHGDQQLTEVLWEFRKEAGDLTKFEEYVGKGISRVGRNNEEPEVPDRSESTESGQGDSISEESGEHTDDSSDQEQQKAS